MGKMNNFLNLEKSKTCAFTGHRTNLLPWRNNEQDERCISFKNKLKNIIIQSIKEGYTNFISGMALGVDIISAEMILNLKNEFSHIKLICSVYYENQYLKWSNEDKARYFNILNKCDKKIFLAKNFSPECIENGNMFLINNSDLLIAVWNGRASETANTIKLAKEKNLKIKYLNPLEI